MSKFLEERISHNQILQKRGITPVPQVAALRSSAHTLRYSRARAKGRGDKGPSADKSFPSTMREKQIVGYDEKEFNLRRAVTRILLSKVDTTLIGGWDDEEENNLEGFSVPSVSLQPHRDNNPGGRGEEAQKALSDAIASDEPFLDLFDRFLEGFVVPWMKRRLVEEGLFSDSDEVTFHYQRPPTLRIQPGLGTRYVRPHKDADYGHQDGELNFWMPLTDPGLTCTDLCVETSPGREDYVPLGVKLGEVAAFHGSSCKHYVPANSSSHTRVSMDFRVGVEGFFDPAWSMLGTISDHDRREVKL